MGLPQENASKPEHLHPNQGGKYVGFGSTPTPSASGGILCGKVSCACYPGVLRCLKARSGFTLTCNRSHASCSAVAFYYSGMCLIVAKCAEHAVKSSVPS